MTAVPAQAAGVKDLSSFRRRRRMGRTTESVLATCHELGIREVYRIGGAQGVAALAYGVEGLAGGPLVKVDKIVGPGNQFVALAKRFVFGDVDIDSIAGPSEIVVIADETTRADFAAADLIAQAEHSPGSSVLITWSEPMLEGVVAELEKQLQQTERGDLARQVARSVRCLDPGQRSRRGRRFGERVCHRTFAHRLRGAGKNAQQDSQRGGSVSGAVQPGGAGRLCGRSLARVADRRDGAVCERVIVE